MLALYASRRGKRGSVGFTTSLAVAMHNGHIHRVYFVTYLTTQTASLQPHDGISFCTFNARNSGNLGALASEFSDCLRLLTLYSIWLATLLNLCSFIIQRAISPKSFSSSENIWAVLGLIKGFIS